MGKTLNVIEDFAYLTAGDVLTLSEDGTEYVAESHEVFDRNSDDNTEFRSSFTSRFTISPAYAQELIENGILEDPSYTDDATNRSFVNVFDEIDDLLSTYGEELEKLPTEMKDQPECLKVEKATVLSNLVSVLNHLKSLKK